MTDTSFFKIFIQAVRAIKSLPLYYLINIIGLALGLACFIVITMHIHREVTTDHFHSNIDKIYCLTSERPLSNSISLYSSLNIKLGGKELNNMPEVALYMHTVFLNETVNVNENNYSAEIISVDSNFFEVFDFNNYWIDSNGNIMVADLYCSKREPC